MQESKTLHYILGISLVMIAVFVVASLVMINTQADNQNTNVVIQNVGPNVDNMFSVSSGTVADPIVDSFATSVITVAASTGTTIYLQGIVSDPNGQADISTVTAKFYLTSVGAGPCAATNSYECYSVASASCTLSTAAPAGGANGTSKSYSCAIPLSFYTKATVAGGEGGAGNGSGSTWTGRVEVKDAANVTGFRDVFTTAANFDSNTGGTRDVGTTLGLTIPSAIDYGTLTPNSATNGGSAPGVAYNITQQGNRIADVNAYYQSAFQSGNLDCSTTGTMSSVPASSAYRDWHPSHLDRWRSRRRRRRPSP